MQWGCHNSDCLAVVCVRVEFRHEFNSDSPTTVWLFTHTCQHHSAMCAVCAPPSCGLLDCELHNIVAGRAYATLNGGGGSEQSTKLPPTLTGTIIGHFTLTPFMARILAVPFAGAVLGVMMHVTVSGLTRKLVGEPTLVDREYLIGAALDNDICR